MEFGIFSFVICFAVLQKKFSDAIPTVTITGKNTFYVGDSLQLSCAVDQDVNLLSVSFFKEIDETIWINNITSCTFSNLIPGDNNTYNTLCSPSKRNFTLIQYHLNASDDGTFWACEMKSAPGGNGSCVGRYNPCRSRKGIILSLHVPTTSIATTTLMKSTDDCALESIPGLTIGVGLGNGITCVICLIFIVILAKSGARKLTLGLIFSNICIACTESILILVMTGKPCALKLGLGLGLAFGIPFVGFLILILFRKEFTWKCASKFLRPLQTPNEQYQFNESKYEQEGNAA